MQETRITSVPQAAQGEAVDVDIIGGLTSHTFMLTALLVLGGLLRYLALRALNFPLGGGALEYQLVRAVQAGGWLPPWELAALYGGGDLPFVYPPLGVYMAAWLSAWWNIPALDFFQVFPAVASLLLIPLMYWLSWTLLRTKALTFTATLAFMLMGAPLQWLIEGAGTVRVVGLVLALIALTRVYALIVRHSENDLFPASLFTVLAFLAHAEMGYFVLYSALVMVLFRGRNRYSILNVVLLLVIVVLLVGLWLVPVVLVYGVMPFVHAIPAVYLPANPLHIFSGYTLTGEPFIPVILTFGLLGLLVTLAKRRFFLPAWFVAIVLLHPRSAGVLALIPLAMMAAVALHQLVLPLIVQMSRAQYAGGIAALRYTGQDWLRETNKHLYYLPTSIFIAALTGYTLFGALVAVARLPAPLSLIEHETMAWIAANPEIAPDARFLVITAADDWESDGVAAWFPVLAGRNSVLTVPHSGWQYNVFQTQQFYERLHGCVNTGSRCLQTLELDIAETRGIRQDGVLPEGELESALVRARTAEETVDLDAVVPRVYDYVYISPNVRGALVEYFASSQDNYLPLRSEGGVRVYQRIGVETSEPSE